jgi:hypothetical protein
MSNNFASNVEKRIATSFGKAFQSQRVLTKAINSQIAQGAFSPFTGSTIYVRKPYESKIFRTSGGDITGQTDDIVSGQVPVTVMDMFTTFANWDVIDEALKMDSMDEIMKPLATRIVTDLELDIANRMMLGGGLMVGTPGTAVTKWSDVAAANTLLEDIGAPMEDCYYVMTPGTREKLADAQKGLSNGDDGLVNEAWRKSVVSKDFGGLTALSSNCLKGFTSGAASDRAGTVTGTVTQTWVGNKDATTQSISVTAFSADTAAAFRAGDVVQITGRNRINPHTGQLLIDSSGNSVKFTGVVQSTTATVGSGVATITISGNAIYESGGKYNNIDSEIVAGDVITLLGTANAVYKPNLFFHKDAFTMATIKLPKLHSTDSYITTKDGFSIRVSKYANGDANTNKVRFDLLAAFGVINPHMAGRGYGV